MQLTGRNLSLEVHGDDVMQLHSELRRLGLTISEEEWRRASFGPGTHEAVLAFQRAYGVPANGIVDARTAGALTEAIATRRALPTPPALLPSTAPGVPHAPGTVAEPVYAVPTQPLPASARPDAASGTSQPAPSGSAPQPRDGSAGHADATVPGVPPPPGAGSPPRGGSGIPPAAGGPAAPPSGAGDAGNAGDAGSFVVQGHVLLSDDTPLAGIAIMAYKAAVGRAPSAIGDGPALTDLEGAYTIHYPASTFARTQTAALLVRVLDSQGKILATSSKLCQPDARTTCDFVVAADTAGIPSEYERLIQLLGPQLEEVEVYGTAGTAGAAGATAPTSVDRLAVLQPEDLDLLADCIGLDRTKLAQLVGAARLQQQARTSDCNVPAPAWYGLARMGLPLDAVGLYQRGDAAIRQGLERALQDNVVPAGLAGALDATLTELRRFVLLATLRTPPAPGRRPIGELLGLVLTPDQQLTYLAVQGAHQNDPQQFWDSLRQQPNFQTPGLVDTLWVNEALHHLTRGHSPLVAVLRQSYRFSSPRELVRLTQAQWVELINTHVNGSPVGVPPDVPGTTPQEQINTYVDGIMRTLQRQYPTDMATVVVTRAPNLNMQPTIRQGILQFFANSPDFDLPRTHVDQYLAANKDTALKGIAQGDQARVVAQVKRLQRLARLSDSPEQMTALLGTRFDSARAIATTPRSTFVRQMQEQLGGTRAAQQLHSKAESMQALVLHVATTVYDEAYGVRPQVLRSPGRAQPGASSVGPEAAGPPPPIVGGSGGPGSGGGAPPSGPAGAIPTLAALFGSLDTCACDDCRSVLGPAAYLVDLLQLLATTPAKLGTDSPSMQQVLFARRPDIPLLNLTCENADTPLPYIDLVNEILETYVAVYRSWYATHASAIDLQQHLDQLGSQATYRPNGPNDGTNDTGDATPDELLASPQYLIDAPDGGAYAELQSAIYPFTLPFDLARETARVYLESQGSSLYEVMRTFQPDGLAVSAPYTSVAQSLNGEYLKLAPQEYTLLTGQQHFEDPLSHQLVPATTSDYYGYTLHPAGSTLASGDSSELATVCEFLKRAGLTLEELIQLLRRRSVNPHYPVIPVLERLGLDYVDVYTLSVQGFPAPAPPNNPSAQRVVAALNTLPNTLVSGTPTYEDFVGWMQTHAELGQVIVIGQQTLPSGNGTPVLECDTCKMTLQHVDGSGLTDAEWRWLYFFIRLWRKLGWAMEDLDDALANWLLPQSWTTLPWPWTPPHDMRAVVDGLSQVAQLRDMLQVPVADLLPLWVDFTGDGTTLANAGFTPISPRYQQLFMNKAVRKIDAIFQPTWQGVAPNPQDPHTGKPPSLDLHGAALVAALRISEADLTTIREQIGLLPPPPAQPVPVTMQTLSTIYRRVLLARALKLRIPDLFSLIALSGLDPFANPGTTIQFVQFVQAVRGSGLSVTQLNYLCRDLDTVPPSLAPKADDVTQLAIQLRAGLLDIVAKTQHVAQDPTGTVLQNALGMIFDAPTVAQAMHMLDGTQVYSTPITLAPTITTPTLAVSQNLQSRVSYSAIQGSSTQGLLRVRGPLSDADKQELLGTSNPDFTDYTTSVTTIWQQPQDFIATAFGGFLPTQQAQTDALRTLLQIDQNLPSPALTTAQKYEYVLQYFLPFLRDRLSHLFVKQTLATALSLDPTVIAALLENVSVLHARTNGTDPAVADALALTTPGLTASYDYLSLSSAAPVGLQTIDPSPLPPTTLSAVYTGAVTTPSAGAYAFSVTTTPGALVQLALDDQGAAVARCSALAPLSTGVVSFPPCTLAAHRTYALTLSISFPDSAPYGTVTAALLHWTPPGQSQAPTTGSFQARYTTSTAPRAQVSVQPPQQLSAFGSGVAWSPGVTGLPLPPQDTAIAGYTGTILVPTGTPNPVGFHLFADVGALLSWVILDTQGIPVGGSHGWQSLPNGRADWTCALTAGQSNALSVQVMASAAAGGLAAAPLTALTGIQLLWDTTQPMLLVPASQPNGVSVTYGVATPWPAIVLQRTTTVVPAVACITADGSLPAGTASAEYHGLLVAAVAGTYTFTVRTDHGAQVQMTVGAKAYEPVLVPSGEGRFVFELTAGKAYALDLVVSPPSNVALTAVELSWQSATQPEASVPSAQLIPASILTTFADLYTVLRKIGVLVTQFHLTADELVYFSVNHAHFGGFDLDLIMPTFAATQATQLMAMVQPVSAYTTLRATLPQSQTSLLDVFRTATSSSATVPDLEQALEQALVRLTGWDQPALHSLMGQGSDGLSLAPASVVNDVAVTRLQACMQAVVALGIAPAKLIHWARAALQGTLSDAEAQDIKRAIKAKVDESAWTAVARPLADTLRERQRDALVAYILALGLGSLNGLTLNGLTLNGLTVDGVPVTDTNLLYEYLLLDPEMSPCMLTSRIVQATAAVQLFVQRCQLGLEAQQVDPQAMDPEVWSWMQLYRLWQANREVFLWPENYLIESLRDDKTPFYKDFEAELLQGQLTGDEIASAVSTYLAKLDQVANLEMCGLFWEEAGGPSGGGPVFEPVSYWEPVASPSGGGPALEPVASPSGGGPALEPVASPSSDTSGDVLHVFGRTRNTPHLYSYRRLLNRTTWTPWERVQVDIEGDHLIPVVWKRRQYLFWPRFMMKTLQDNTTQRTYWEITLAWSEYKRGSWQRKEVSNRIGYFSGEGTGGPNPPQASSTTDGFTGDISHAYPPNLFFFRAHLRNDGGLGIGMYCREWRHALDYYSDSFWLNEPELAFALNGHGGHVDVTVGNLPPIYAPEDTLAEWMTFVWDVNSSDGQQSNPQGILRIYDTSASATPMASKSLPSVPLLEGSPTGKYDVLPVTRDRQLTTQQPFFYQDRARAYLCLPGTKREYFSVAPNTLAYNDRDVSIFSHHYQPYVSQFVGDLSRDGLATLLNLKNQELSEHTAIGSFGGPSAVNQFGKHYAPTDSVDKDLLPFEQVDFDRNKADSPFADYHWELFFHIPFRIALLLSQERKFEAAEAMFRYVFDITKSPAYWQVLPFTGVDPQAEQIETLLIQLHQEGEQSPVQAQIDAMKQHPFEPHRLARLRVSARMMSVVMQYIGHHLAWGDHLYRLADQASDREFLNEALQHYILVAQLLGPRPQTVPNPGRTRPQNYNQLKAEKLDAFSNALVALENEFPFLPTASGDPGGPATGSGATATTANVFYFCIPPNDQLLGVWDTVEDRLFKIRHCMTIDGVVQQLPLFAPPINPLLLVQAAAQGIDLGSVLNDLYAPLPSYRFTYMLPKALELCADVRALGAALLAALEKQDGEALALMRATHETALLTAMHDVRQQQVDEANAALAALRQTRAVTAERFLHYSMLLGVQSPRVPAEGEAINVGSPPGGQQSEQEQTHLDKLAHANDQEQFAYLNDQLAKTFRLIPEFNVGQIATGTANFVTLGGQMLADAAEFFSVSSRGMAAQLTYEARRAEMLGVFGRRDEEWTHQLTLAAKELTQIDAQIATADIRSQIVAKELQHHELQTSHAQDVQEFLTSKFSAQDLYDWMAGQISTLYYQAYSMAYDLAKQAERAYRFERGLTDSTYIQFGYWDSAHQGLMAGEQLHLALRQLERAYQDQQKRDYELTKQISLALLDPLALVLLKEWGVCEIELPEALFDADYPGHYMRRLKTVAITIPCVVGPYTSINGTLTLLSNKTRISSNAIAAYPEGDDDRRFVYNFAAVQSIATSHAQNDTGLFELNFRDERYLPFEGAGAISRWRLELPRDTNALERDTITDVILRLQYTARDGGAPLQQAARTALVSDPSATSGARLFSAKHEFAAQWIQFLTPTNPALATLDLDFGRERFPFQLRGKTVTIGTIELYLVLDDLLGKPTLTAAQAVWDTLTAFNVTLTAPANHSNPASQPQPQFARDLNLEPAKVLKAHLEINDPQDNRGLWHLAIDRATIPTALAVVTELTQPPTPQPPYQFDGRLVRDLLIVCQYAISS